MILRSHLACNPLEIYSAPLMRLQIGCKTRYYPIESKNSNTGWTREKRLADSIVVAYRLPHDRKLPKTGSGPC
jgi:hypothetical protein